MKKSELDKLTQIIEMIVAKEVRKQLPTIIAETFQNMMGTRAVVNEQVRPAENVTIMERVEEEARPPVADERDFKASLRELFAGTPVMKTSEPTMATNAPRPIRQFTKDPKLNQILNETVGDLRDRDRFVGAAAFQGGYSPALAMVPGFSPPTSIPGVGEMMPDTEVPSFARTMPSMPGTISGIPVGKPPILTEGQISTHAPMEALPQGVSVHDIKQHAPAAVQGALTRNYSQMMKLIDKKKGKV